MNNPLRTPEDYELFLYTLTEQFPSALRSTIALVRRGATLARVAGEIHFDHGIHHPNDPALQDTHPHHKHVSPGMKHHRVSAPEMSFTRPNLPTLIQEIEALVERINEAP